jgi:hypothetical protein
MMSWKWQNSRDIIGRSAQRDGWEEERERGREEEPHLCDTPTSQEALSGFEDRHDHFGLNRRVGKSVSLTRLRHRMTAE